MSRKNCRIVSTPRLALVVSLLAILCGNAEAAPWTMQYEHEVSMVFVDDILVPIEVKKPSLIIKNAQTGSYYFSGGTMRSATRIPVISTGLASSPQNFSVRPTLFVSIKGLESAFQTSSEGFPSRIQNQYVTAFAQATNARYSQYKHFNVQWEGNVPLGGQVDDAFEVLKSFLDERAYPWDVVIIGYSRGGIFAHNLTKRLVGHKNVKNLHTFLLDPTAATVVGDAYPIAKYTSPGTNHFGSLFYDNRPFLYYDATINSYFATDSDFPIPGYDNYGRADAVFSTASHTDFARDWVGCAVGANNVELCDPVTSTTSTSDNNARFKQALADIWARKDTGTFAADGDSGYEILQIHRSTFDIGGSIYVSDGNVYMSGSVVLGESAGASIDGYVGKNGVDVTASAMMKAVQVQVSRDEANVRASDEYVTVVASASATGASTYVDVVGLATASTQITGGQVTVVTGGTLVPSTSTTINPGSGEVSIAVNGHEITPPSPSSILGLPKIKLKW